MDQIYSKRCRPGNGCVEILLRAQDETVKKGGLTYTEGVRPHTVDRTGKLSLDRWQGGGMLGHLYNICSVARACRQRVGHCNSTGRNAACRKPTVDACVWESMLNWLIQPRTRNAYDSAASRQCRYNQGDTVVGERGSDVDRSFL